MSNTDNVFDLTNPKDARRFVSRLWIASEQITGVKTASGWKRFTDMNDDEVTRYASELHTDWMANENQNSKVEYREPVIQ